MHRVDESKILALTEKKEVDVPVEGLLEFPHVIYIGQSMHDVFAAFRKYPEQNYFPVLSFNEEPLGIIRESDFRLHIYNPFGRALLDNPSCFKQIKNFIHSCPVAEKHTDAEFLMNLFNVSDTHYGIIITENGRYIGFINPRMILKKANAHRMKSMEALNRAYQRFVPRRFLEILESPDVMTIEAGNCRKKNMSILFSDIRSFTSLAESMTPEEVFSFLNAYFYRMEPAILNNGGYIDKYLGDGLMALFEQSADHAVIAALEMLENLKLYNEERKRLGRKPFHIGIGINTGELMLGTIGGIHQMTGTVISDAVNIASRVEGLTKIYKTPLLITQQHYKMLKNPGRFSIRLLDSVLLKGKSRKKIIYEVFDADEEESRNFKKKYNYEFQTAVKLFHTGDIQKAEELFIQCGKIYPEDAAVKLYLKRCRIAEIT